MNKEEILEGDILIAEFMGGVYGEYPDGLFPGEYGYRFSKDVWWNIKKLQYHSSWDWLMPVVEKIEGLGYKFKQCRKRVEIWIDEDLEQAPKMLLIVKESTKIGSAWKAVTDFIKWYNQSQNKTK